MVTTVTDENFASAIAENAKVVVKFHADWCGSCKLFAPKFKRMAQNETYKDFTFLEIDAEKNPEARKVAKVSTLPFFAVFKNGELVAADSTSKEEYLVSMMDKANA